MKSNVYPNNTYPRRGQSRYEAPAQPTFGKKIVEEFLTQFTICALITMIIFGAQRLGIPKVSMSMAKVKTIITYSPSLKEIVKEAKNGTIGLIEKITSNGKESNKESENEEINHQEIPMIIVDDEIF